MTRRWDPAVSHRGDGAEGFLTSFFTAERRVTLIAGAGFDPRAGVVLQGLADAGAEVGGAVIREVRPDAPQFEQDRADGNQVVLLDIGPNLEVIELEIFGTDGAVVGGRNVVSALRSADFSTCTDVVIDLSALSVGVGFPVVRYAIERVLAEQRVVNLHVFVVHNPRLDATIRSVPSDVPGYVHGYRGEATVDATSTSARLWLPHLASGAVGTLDKLFAFVDPHDTCPVLPFPSLDPRDGDRLAEEFISRLDNAWEVDPRNVVYADEADPLDLYRTILQLDDLRRPVFEEAGGSLLILSPVGSKVMALGAMLAALERGLPVAHLETIGYEMDGIERPRGDDTLLHVWLEGEAYRDDRPGLPGPMAR